MFLGLDVVMVTSPLLEPLSIDTSSLSLVVLFSDPFLPNKVSLNQIKIYINSAAAIEYCKRLIIYNYYELHTIYLP